MIGRTQFDRMRGHIKRVAYRSRMKYEQLVMQGYRVGGDTPGMRRYHDPSSGNRHLLTIIESGKPSMIARYGIHELRAVGNAHFGYKGPNALKKVCLNAGFFPSDEVLLAHFADQYASSSQCIDVFCACNFRHGLKELEEKVFSTFCPDAYLTDIRALNFLDWMDEEPWTSALEGKRLLVVHPFADQIEKQYSKRSKLFSNLNVLPELGDLICIEAVQSAGGNNSRFSTWFEALEYMRNRMDKQQYDVALIGAGAYSLPLSENAKHQGAVGIHLGGLTQMLFGIYGRRWLPKYQELINENWVRPDPTTRPPKYREIEGGAYW